MVVVVVVVDIVVVGGVVVVSCDVVDGILYPGVVIGGASLKFHSVVVLVLKLKF